MAMAIMYEPCYTEIWVERERDGEVNGNFLLNK